MMAVAFTGASPLREPAQREQGQPEQSVANSLASIAASLEESNEADEANPPCAKGEDNRQSDLCAQWKAADSASRAADWTERTFWLGVVGAIIGLATLTAAAAAAWFAKEAADHTLSGASAANASVDVAKDSARRQLRAYVQPGGLTIHDMRPGNTPYVTFEVKNRGATPAKKLWVKGSLQIVLDHTATKFFFDGEPTYFELGPHQSSGDIIFRFEEPLSPEQFVGFDQGEWTCCLGGYIVYRDVFGVTRRSIFRGHLDPREVKDGEGSFIVSAKHFRST